MKTLLFIFLSLLLSVQGMMKVAHNFIGDLIDSGGVEINPKTINAVSNFRAYAFLVTTIPSGGKIRVIFPKEITR